ncbi:MAG: hypothetical protein UR39_C0007G0004 [Candidatus Woesebacteria bacterium GW2011_GWA1_33_30]|uniref:Transposase IS200-like domain-containing protein n=1 Tax=Candidatus Woesebacteria bacterium GW2011_GWA2_33_28 TaxID=1618561 RepID=A0A0G0A6D0_9BACT|nr:MAG: hypothetical protein UR38_C0007G0004 [Candidatus Woesebacteria bacterium GW2011_GWA2_33_28]KKP47786.1 MAG: hypothetical protein UR39_C0007G0004 [Candidatus Woesebacteria bacterium GW2011_GWA1_33_30]KKP49231.1 MAG: hypothetical protein UR40_C0008G0004 [Microgenomates group bacterium GW2011_GWC1_33_32]KKP56148.1 MAG: hypothetical protein UR48_C0039G0007 [Microgenomates group bacterium GW2011_GWD1_33_9]
MPAKNVVKLYLPNSIYHIYNRGVEKRKIFLDEQDHKVFLNYLKEYLSTPQKPSLQNIDIQDLKGRTFQFNYHVKNNYFENIELVAFCLMPNHIHLLIKQTDKDAIKKFTQSLFTRYSVYFNKRYNRRGPLFEGKYKATNVVNKDYLLDITRYIHKNPSKLSKNIVDYYSSYAHYLDHFNIPWVKNKEVLDYFNESSFIKSKKIKNYKEFVEDFKYINEELDLTKDIEG